MTRREYCALIIEPFPSIELTGKLNDLGSRGWELVTIMAAKDETGRAWKQAVFKRMAEPSN